MKWNILQQISIKGGLNKFRKKRSWKFRILDLFLHFDHCIFQNEPLISWGGVLGWGWDVNCYCFTSFNNKTNIRPFKNPLYLKLFNTNYETVFWHFVLFAEQRQAGVNVGYRMLNNGEEKPDQKLTVGLSSTNLYVFYIVKAKYFTLKFLKYFQKFSF